LVITRASHARGHEFDPRFEYFFLLLYNRRRKFGRVVKAVALGAILVRGRGSNPLACIFFTLFFIFFFSLVFRPVLNRSECAQKEKNKKEKTFTFGRNRTCAIRDDHDLNVTP
jgi:hypothetical protein